MAFLLLQREHRPILRAKRGWWVWELQEEMAVLEFTRELSRDEETWTATVTWHDLITKPVSMFR